MAVDWSIYLDKSHDNVKLDETWGILHQGAAILTWVASVDNDQPVYKLFNDHPDTFNAIPTKIDSLPNVDHRYVRDVATQTKIESEMCYHAKIGGVWEYHPITQRSSWSVGDLAIIVAIASETALDDMIDVSNRYHLPLMRVYCDVSQGADPGFAPSLAFTVAQIGIINTWFSDLGTNGNTKYPSGLTAIQVANYFSNFVPEVTSPATMSTWMQANPRHRTIATFAQIFEYVP